MSDLVGHWHDEKGAVVVDLANEEVVYYVRNGKSFVLGRRRFLRDFQRGAGNGSPTPAPTGERTLTCWLIERSQLERVDPPQYWADETGNERTTNPRAAFRFFTRELAEEALWRACSHAREDGRCEFHGHVAEHVFLAVERAALEDRS